MAYCSSRSRFSQWQLCAIVARLGEAFPWRQLYDFPDFYCAGKALDRGADPYRYEPLHRCEHAVNVGSAYRKDPQRVVPAPLPPYDFPPFMLAARLNFPVARLVGALAIGAAVVAAMWGLALVGVPLDVAALALLLPAGYVLLNAGQVVPFALAALVFCGVALARGLDRLAGICAALTLIEPHLGLPVCATMLCWVSRGRPACLQRFLRSPASVQRSSVFQAWRSTLRGSFRLRPPQKPPTSINIVLRTFFERSAFRLGRRSSRGTSPMRRCSR